LDSIEQRFFERQLVVFRIGDEHFGVDISDVREIIKPPEFVKVPDSEDYIEGIINLRGGIVTIINLARRLGMGSDEKGKRGIVTEIAGSSVGFTVDACNEVLRITGDKIQEAPSMVKSVDRKFLQGVANLQDRIILIIDLGKVLGLEERSTTGKGRKLLIVEDSTMMRGTLKSYIDGSKYQVVEAEDAETAMKLIETEKPEIALLDIKLPGMSGVELLSKMSGISVIMETSVYDEETKKECLSLGAKAYLKKPISKKELEEALAAL